MTEGSDARRHGLEDRRTDALIDWAMLMLQLGFEGAGSRPEDEPESWSPTAEDAGWRLCASVPVDNDWREVVAELAAAGSLDVDATTGKTFVGTSGHVLEFFLDDVRLMGHAGFHCRVVCVRDRRRPLLGQVREKLALQGACLVTTDAEDAMPRFADGVTAEAVRVVLLDVAATSPDLPDRATHVMIGSDGIGAPAPVAYRAPFGVELEPSRRDRALFALVQGWAQPRGLRIRSSQRRADKVRWSGSDTGRRMLVEIPRPAAATTRAARAVAEVPAARARLRAWLASIGCSDTLVGEG